MQLKIALATLILAVVVGFALPAAAGAADRPAFRTYMACAKVKEAKPAHSCSRASEKGAFFRSNLRAASYSVCVTFPTRRVLCAKRQMAVKGEVYLNEITTKMLGAHRITWFVRGKKVGSIRFRVTA